MRKFTVSKGYIGLYAKSQQVLAMSMITTTIEPNQGSFGWTDVEHGDLAPLNKNRLISQVQVAENPLFFIEHIQALSEKVRLWGYQLIYDDSNTCHWCIADVSGNILWRNYGLSRAIWRLEQQLQNS